MYKIEWSPEAEKHLAKIDRTIARKITNKVENYLIKNPAEYGKPLTGKWKGRWKFRFSDYRVIYEILHNKLLILVVEVGHRKDIYE